MDQFVITLMNVGIVHVIQMQSAQIHLALTAALAKMVILEMALIVQVGSFDFWFIWFLSYDLFGTKECKLLKDLCDIS